jgi:transposase-like protein
MAGGAIDRDKEIRWQELVEQQKTSGKSQSEFCKEHKLRDNQFSYWKKALMRRSNGKSTAPKKNGTPSFISLQLPEPVNFHNKVTSTLDKQIEISKITVRISSAQENILTCILQSLGQN